MVALPGIISVHFICHAKIMQKSDIVHIHLHIHPTFTQKRQMHPEAERICRITGLYQKRQAVPSETRPTPMKWWVLSTPS